MKENDTIKRFFELNALISNIYTDIAKIKGQEMNEYGLKASHILCICELYKHQEGLDGATLSKNLNIDKAAISRCLSSLIKKGLVIQKQSNSYYRAPFILTEKGKEIAIYTLAKIEEFMSLFGVFEDERKRDAFYSDLHKVENSIHSLLQRRNS